MSYLDKNLLAGERVIYRANLHKAVFLWPVLIIAFGLTTWSSGPDAAFTILLVGICAALYSYMDYSSSEFGVTNKRVLVKVGILSSRSIELLLPKIEGISVKQGLLGKRLDYGTIIVSGTGGTKEPFKTISKPFEFRKRVQEQIASIQSSK